MSSAGTGATLVQAYKDLELAWEKTKESWHDIKSQQFEQTYLEPLPGNVERAIAAMGEIDLLMKKIRSDLE